MPNMQQMVTEAKMSILLNSETKENCEAGWSGTFDLLASLGHLIGWLVWHILLDGRSGTFD